MVSMNLKFLTFALVVISFPDAYEASPPLERHLEARTVSTPTPANYVAITSVNLFDGNTVTSDATVVFDAVNGTIVSITTSASPTDPVFDIATTVDGTNKTLIPGLIEGHMHMESPDIPTDPYNQERVLRSALKCGVTTVCDMLSTPTAINTFKADIMAEVERARSEISSGASVKSILLADLKSALFAATVPEGWPRPILEGEVGRVVGEGYPNISLTNIQTFMDEQTKLGADYIKIMQEDCHALDIKLSSIPVPTIRLQTAVVKAAHAAGYLVFAHAISDEAQELVLKAGADAMAHAIMDQHASETLLGLYKKNRAFMIPTLVGITSMTGEAQDQRAKFADIAFSRKLVDEETRDWMNSSLSIGAEGTTAEYAYEMVRNFMLQGIDVVAGTDSLAGLKGTGVGPSLWFELSLYVERCGMSAIDALKSATSVSARRFRFEDRGTIEVGKRADLVLVAGNPTQRLEALWEGEGIVGVWKQGLRAM